ncbi:MAG: carboxymuconolactone decarboxylase [Betaproteobacteria bacterium]|nr:carboxymuconolactone decarboxylase [Betaproteobacteria bacterium]
MAETNRIKEIPDNEMTAAQKKVFADLIAGRGKLLGPYKIWIHSPKFAAAMETIGTFLNKASSLAEREVELVICIIANHWRGEYVWAAHVKRCLELGYKQAVFDAMRAGQTPTFEHERERAIFDLATIAMAPGGGSDEVFDRAEKLLGRNGVAEVLGLLGYYSAVSMGMKLHRVPIPKPA